MQVLYQAEQTIAVQEIQEQSAIALEHQVDVTQEVFNTVGKYVHGVPVVVHGEVGLQLAVLQEVLITQVLLLTTVNTAEAQNEILVVVGYTRIQ